MRALVIAAIAGVIVALAGVASAQPGTSDALREGNTAASAGDWPRVSALVDPLLRGQLPAADLAEAHRLAGLAAFFQQQREIAEAHFVQYLKLEHDGRLDPALYRPEVVQFLDDVKARHPELRVRRVKQKRYWWLNLVPPGGQIQNGERVKAYVIGGLIGAFAIANVTSYFVLRSWCTRVSGAGGDSVTCDEEGKDRARTASTLRTINIVSGVGLIATYLFGVYDGVSGYRRHSEAPQPFIAPASGGGVVGVTGSF